MTIERLSENPVLPYDREAIIKGGLPLARYLHELVVDIIQKEYLYKIIYYINHLPQTMTWSDGDSCDATHPVTVRFKIPDEMTEITSVKVSFWLEAFRAYSQGAASGGGATSGDGGGTTVSSASGGGQTTSSGGGQTSSSGGGQTTSSGGAQTSSAGGAQTSTSGGGVLTSTANASGLVAQAEQAGGATDMTSTDDGTGDHEHSWQEDYPGHSHDISDHNHSITLSDHTHDVVDHTHTVDNHTHTVNDHTHTVSDHTHTVDDHTHSVTVGNHTHTVPAHTHDLTFGIYEETNTPTVYYKVDDGSGLGAASDNYTEDQTDIDITAQITTVGAKRIVFYSDSLCRIRAAVEVKVKVRAE